MPWIYNNLFKMLGLFNKYSRATKHSYQIIRLLSSREIGFTKNSFNHDILFQNLKNAPTTENLLELISSHHTIMNNNHIIQAFRSIFYLQKSGDTSATTKEILSHPNFKSLCISLKSQVRSLEINELVETLKILSYVGVPSTSTITQILLQMIRQNVNNFSLQQIIFLDFLLKQFHSTPLSDALLIALPIIFEIQLPMKADTDNLSMLTDLLQFATRNKLSDSSTTYLLDAIASNKHINHKAAVSTVWSICDSKPRDSYEPLIKKLLKIIIKYSDEIQISELETILTKLVYRYSKKYPFYFDKDYFKVVAEYVISNDLGFQQTIWILQKFSKVGYSHHGLLDYLSTLCHNDQMVISKTDTTNLYNIVTAFSNTDYKPVHWESVKQGILENKYIFDGRRKINWIQFATRLAILDIYIPAVLKQALHTENIERFLEDRIHASSENLLILYQTIITLHPEYTNMLPDNSYIQRAISIVYSTSIEDRYRPLQAALERGFGGEPYVLTNVITNNGHLLHHVVAMRKGGYPIAFNVTEQKQPLVLEDLQIPADSHVVAVFGCDSSYYKLDENILKCINKLMFRTIEASGYSVVPVSLETWNKLSDYEKIPYLMQSVRLKDEEHEKTCAVESYV